MSKAFTRDVDQVYFAILFKRTAIDFKISSMMATDFIF